MKKAAATDTTVNPFAAFTSQGFAAPAFSPEAMIKSFGGFEGVTSHAKQNLEAVTASVAVAAKGAEALRDEALSYSKSGYESVVAHMAALKGAASPQEAVELQVAFGKAAVETFLKQVNVTSELFATTLRESAAPISARAATVVAKIQPQA